MPSSFNCPILRRLAWYVTIAPSCSARAVATASSCRSCFCSIASKVFSIASSSLSWLLSKLYFTIFRWFFKKNRLVMSSSRLLLYHLPMLMQPQWSKNRADEAAKLDRQLSRNGYWRRESCTWEVTKQIIALGIHRHIA